MRIARRLYFAVAPAILGVLVVAGLAYWGERGHAIPVGTVASIAVIASIASLIAAWRNTRYVARRVAHLTSEVEEQRLTATVGAQKAERRADEYAELLDAAMTRMGSNLEQARLPLHILLSSPFGALNENQEEMLAAAEGAIDTADGEATQLRRLIEIDRGTVAFSPERLSLRELLRAPTEIAKARAARSAVRVVADIADPLLSVLVDPMRTQEALTAMIGDAVRHAPPGGEVRIRARRRNGARVVLTISPRLPVTGPSLEVRLATRILEHEGGALGAADDASWIELPADRSALAWAPSAAPRG